MEALAPLHDPLSGVVVVLLADFLRQHQGWGWLRLVAGATPYKDVLGEVITGKHRFAARGLVLRGQWWH